jgi:hypothetical protein
MKIARATTVAAARESVAAPVRLCYAEPLPSLRVIAFLP